jgi:hypothetical protein
MEHESTMSLPESLERAATALPELADAIRPANGDPHRLLDELAPEPAAQLLGWLLDQSPVDAEELVEAWEEREEGVALLLSAQPEGLSKGGRKLLRRAHHRLRSRGLEVAVSSAPAVPRRVVSSQADRWQAGYVSAPDFRGTRMGYLVDSHPSSGARLFEARFDEERGLLDFKVYNSGRSKVRGFLKSLVESSGRRLFEVDRDALRALIWRAARAQSLSRPLPTGFVEWRSRLFGDELEKQETPGEIARGLLPVAEISEAIGSVAARVREGQLGPWPPSSEWVGDRMDRGRESVDRLEGEARGAAIEAWIQEICDALCRDSDQALIARNLEELAWIESESGETAAACALLAVASGLPDDEETVQAIGRARVESLFEPFLASLRVVETDPLSAGDGQGSVGD